MRSRNRNLFNLIISISVIMVLLLLLLVYDKEVGNAKIFKIVTKKSEPDKHTMDKALNEVMACKIPKLNPFDASIVKLYRQVKPFNCSHTRVFFEANFLSELPSIVQINDLLEEWGPCCYRNLVYQSTYNYKKLPPGVCTPLQSKITPVSSETEYVHIICKTNLTIDNNGTSKPLLHEEILTFIPVKQATSESISIDKADRVIETPNVLIIGFDHNSRMNFIRQMPKTYKIMKKLGVIEMLGFNKMGDATFNNTNAFLMGLSYTELRQTCWKKDSEYFDSCPWIWKDFKNNGYLTSLSDDLTSVYRYRFKGFKNQPTDYYLQPFITGMPKMSTLTGLCFGTQSRLLTIPDNIKKTAWSLRNEPYFQFAWQTRVQHKYALMGVTDHSWSEILLFLKDRNLLNNTIIILLSDHGWRFGRIMYTPQGRYENRLPFAYFIFPKWFKEKYSAAISNLKENANRLTSPYDIYSTLKDLANLPQISSKEILQSRTSDASYPSRGISLFLPIPRNRSCKSAGIDEHWCTCDRYQHWPNFSPLALEIGIFTVNEINSWLIPFPKCSEFILKSIIKFEVKTDSKLNRTSEAKNFNAFKIIFSVYPGKGEFEATVLRRSDGSLSLSTEISRINVYGSQSHCIKVYMMKKICYCKKQLKKKTSNSTAANAQREMATSNFAESIFTNIPSNDMEKKSIYNL